MSKIKELISDEAMIGLERLQQDQQLNNIATILASDLKQDMKVEKPEYKGVVVVVIDDDEHLLKICKYIRHYFSMLLLDCGLEDLNLRMIDYSSHYKLDVKRLADSRKHHFTLTIKHF